MDQENKTDPAHEKPKFSVRSYLGWKIAICYHPMYMLVDEDRGEPVIGERIHPWGARTAEEYIERVKRNLRDIEQDPGLRLNYEWAASSLADVAHRFPDVLLRMQEAYARGQLDFVGGEFSLAHTNTYGSESTWRQFAYGLEIFKRLFEKQITVHAHQESHIFPQLPQILRRFGYEFLVLPSFPWAINILDGKFELMGHERGVYIKKQDEFISLEAPDQTTIPAYFATNVRQTRPEDEMMKDLWGCPPVWIDFPDLEEFHNPIEGWAAPVLLSEIVAERYRRVPPDAKGKLHTYYSYVEGIWAEEHQRESKLAEEWAVLAGNMVAIGNLAGLKRDLQSAIDAVWQKILKYQDHDVTWIEVTDLRRKAINQFKECVNACKQIAIEEANLLVKKDDDSLAIFNCLPRARKAYLELDAQQIPGGGPRFQKVGEKYIGIRELPAGGFASFLIDNTGWGESKQDPLPEQLVTERYIVDFFPNGLIRQITTCDGQDLLASNEYMGGEIRCVIGDDWVDNRAANCSFYTGEVCFILERKGRLGNIPLLERYYFYKHEPIVKIELEFDFNGDSVGNFHIEETKINIYFPSTGPDIYYDTPFGYEQGCEQEQLVAINWVFCGGLIYVNTGTPKHWVRNQVVANTIGWGSNQEWTNRIHYKWWMERCKAYDLRLYGKQRITSFLIPAGKDFAAASIVPQVEALVAPIVVTNGKGGKSFLEIKDSNLVITALYPKDEHVYVRGYQLPAENQGRFRDWEIFNENITEFQ